PTNCSGWTSFAMGSCLRASLIFSIFSFLTLPYQVVGRCVPACVRSFPIGCPKTCFGRQTRQVREDDLLTGPAAWRNRSAVKQLDPTLLCSINTPADGSSIQHLDLICRVVTQQPFVLQS